MILNFLSALSLFMGTAPEILFGIPADTGQLVRTER